MRKNDLRNGMIVRSSGGRYGVVVLQDATDSNCIKFFYDPNLLIEHGSIERARYGSLIEPLDNFNEDLQVVLTEEDVKKPGLEDCEVGAVCWSIDQVFSLNEVWRRDN